MSYGLAVPKSCPALRPVSSAVNHRSQCSFLPHRWPVSLIYVTSLTPGSTEFGSVGSPCLDLKVQQGQCKLQCKAAYVFTPGAFVVEPHAWVCVKAHWVVCDSWRAGPQPPGIVISVGASSILPNLESFIPDF